MNSVLPLRTCHQTNSGLTLAILWSSETEASRRSASGLGIRMQDSAARFRPGRKPLAYEEHAGKPATAKIAMGRCQAMSYSRARRPGNGNSAPDAAAEIVAEALARIRESRVRIEFSEECGPTPEK